MHQLPFLFYQDFFSALKTLKGVKTQNCKGLHITHLMIHKIPGDNTITIRSTRVPTQIHSCLKREGSQRIVQVILPDFSEKQKTDIKVSVHHKNELHEVELGTVMLFPSMWCPQNTSRALNPDLQSIMPLYTKAHQNG